MAIDFKVTFSGGSPDDRKNDDFKIEPSPQDSEKKSEARSISADEEPMKIPEGRKSKLDILQDKANDSFDKYLNADKKADDLALLKTDESGNWASTKDENAFKKLDATRKRLYNTFADNNAAVEAEEDKRAYLKEKFLNNSESLSKKELVELATEEKIRNVSSLTKAKIIKRIETELGSGKDDIVTEDDYPSSWDDIPEEESPVAVIEPKTTDDDYPSSWDDLDDEPEVPEGKIDYVRDDNQQESKEEEYAEMRIMDSISDHVADRGEGRPIPISELRVKSDVGNNFESALKRLEDKGILDLTVHPDVGSLSDKERESLIPVQGGYGDMVIVRNQFLSDDKLQTPEPSSNNPKTIESSKEPIVINYGSDKSVKENKKQPTFEFTDSPEVNTGIPANPKQEAPDDLVPDTDDSPSVTNKSSSITDVPKDKIDDLRLQSDDGASLNTDPSVTNKSPSVPETPKSNSPDLFDFAASSGGGGKEPPIKTTSDMPEPEDEDDEDPLLKFAETNTSPDTSQRTPSSNKPNEGSDPLFEFGDANESNEYNDIPNLQQSVPDVKNPKVAANFQKELDKVKAKERRALSVGLTQAKRRADKQTKIQNRRYSKELTKQRRQIDNESRSRKAEILETNKRADSDRMIRRLTTFGIGRAVGIDGGMLTAFAELAIFQPESDLAEKGLEERLKAVQDDRAEQLASLESANTNTAENRDYQSIDIAEIIDDARLRLRDEENPTSLPEVERELAGVLNQDLNQYSGRASVDPQGTPQTASGTNPSGSTPNASQTQQTTNAGQGTASNGGGSQQPPSGPPPNNTPPNPAGSGGGGNSRGGFVNNVLGTFGGSISAATGKLLIAQIALQGLATASKLAEAGITNVGKAIDSPYSVSSQSASVGIAGDAAVGVSTVAGSLIGNTVFGPIGAVAGAIIGKAVSSAIIDPLVTLVETGTGQLDGLSKESLGPRTIQSRVDQSIEKLIKRMELSERLDETTSSFVDTQTDFGSALSDLKGGLAQMFGPPIQVVTQIVTIIVRVVDIIVAINVAIAEFMQIIPMLKGLLWTLKNISDMLEWMLSWFRSSTKVSTQMMDSIYGFFGGDAGQSFQGSATVNRNATNTSFP